MPSHTDDMDFMDSDFEDGQRPADPIPYGGDRYSDPGATPVAPAERRPGRDDYADTRTPPHAGAPHYRMHTPHQGRSRSQHGSPPVGSTPTPLAAAPPAWSPSIRRRRDDDGPSTAQLLEAILQGKAETVREIRGVAELQAAQAEAINDLSARTRQVEENTERTANDLASLAERVSALEQRPSTKSSEASSSAPSSASSTRSPGTDPYELDKTIIRLSTNSPVTATAMREAIATMLERAGYPQKDVDLKGPQLGLRFVLKHRSLIGGPARDFVDNVLDARREPGGGWLDIQIVSPAGDNIVVYVNRDASRSQRRTAWHLSRAARAPRAVAPGRVFDVAKSAAAVVYQWKSIAKCHYNAASDSADVAWDQELISQLGIDIAQLRDAYSNMVQSGPRQARG